MNKYVKTAYEALERHGDTMVEKKTGRKCFMINARKLPSETTGATAFNGYSMDEVIHCKAYVQLSRFDEKFSFGTRMVITEKHRPFYVGEAAWEEFSKSEWHSGYVSDIDLTLTSVEVKCDVRKIKMKFTREEIVR